MRDLIRHATTLGARVHYAPLDDEPDLLGYYLPNKKIIVLRLGLTYAQTRWVLAHECGHAFHDHRCGNAHRTDAIERQADAYAARLLIDPAEYATLERINPEQHWLADELGVSVDAIHAYERHCLAQVRGAAYAHSRMGAGQYAYRGQHP